MMLKVFDLLISLGWYLVSFIYDLIDGLLSIIKQLNAFDIINSLSDNSAFRGLFTGILAIAVTVFALVIIWRFINKLLEPDEETSFKNIITEIIKCGLLIMLSTFLFVQVSRFSIALSSYTGNIFESNTGVSMSDTMLSMFITYKDSYKNSDKFEETSTIPELVGNGSFDRDELYLDKYVTKAKIIFSDEKDYKYEINWLMAIICGGFFLYSLFFAGIMLGKRQIEFLFLFAISPIIFATSVCNKQRRGAVIEQLVSLALQSAVVMLVVTLSVMVMQQVNETTFFTNSFMDIVTKVLLYLGSATFVLTGSQVINRFIGANVSASSGREQLMSLIGYGNLTRMGATAIAGTTIGGSLLATGGAMKAGNYAKNNVLSTVGSALATYGAVDTTTGSQSRIQKMASTIGGKMYSMGQSGFNKSNSNKGFKVSDSIVNMGANSINSAIKTVVPKASYNTSYYKRRKNMM